MTVIWGLYDTVSPPRVASYVWNEYLMLKPGGNRLYFIPDANHYLQVDRPDAFVKVAPARARTRRAIRHPAPSSAELGAPLLVDSSRERLPAAADLLRAEDSRRPELRTRAPENEYFIRAHSHARTGNGRRAPFRFSSRSFSRASLVTYRP